MERKLAKISSATLNIKDRGILNFWIMVDYEDGLSQGIGGITLDEYDKEKKRRVGTSYGCEMIRRALETLGVNDFSEMAGRHIWVIGEGKGIGFEVKGFAPLRVDNSKAVDFIFSDVADEFISVGS